MSREVPFASADEAWIWTMLALVARREGARLARGRGDIPRPCVPDDVVKVLDRLYRQRRIDLDHARVLRMYGELGRSPDRKVPDEAFHARVWREAMERLDFPLREKAIVAASPGSITERP